MNDYSTDPPALRPGMVVCMTGAESSRTRDSLFAWAEACGVECKKNMTSLVEVLVSADPTSQSGKAREARALGRPVVPYSWLTDGLYRLESRNESLAGRRQVA